MAPAPPAVSPDLAAALAARAAADPAGRQARLIRFACWRTYDLPRVRAALLA